MKKGEGKAAKLSRIKKQAVKKRLAPTKSKFGSSAVLGFPLDR